MRLSFAVCLLALGCTEEPVAPPGPETPVPRPPEVAPAPPPPPLKCLEGRVVRSDGGATAARLKVMGKSRPTDVDTDAQGHFAIPTLAPGEVQVEVRAEGEIPMRRSAYVPQRDFVFRMTEGRTLSVTSASADEARIEVWFCADGVTWEPWADASTVKGRLSVQTPAMRLYVQATVGEVCSGLFLPVESDGVAAFDLDAEALPGVVRTRQDEKKGSKRLPEVGKGWSLRAVPNGGPGPSPCLTRSTTVGKDGAFTLNLTRGRAYAFTLTRPDGKTEEFTGIPGAPPMTLVRTPDGTRVWSGPLSPHILSGKKR